MPAAAADAPTGSHHVLAMKKYVLISVISQMMMSSTRPIRRDLPRFSVFPTAATRRIFRIRAVGPQTVASVSQLFSSASAFLHLLRLFCSHRTPGASSRQFFQFSCERSQTRIDDFFSFHLYDAVTGGSVELLG